MTINKKAKMGEAESEVVHRETAEELAERLLKADVISFDIFDTLILKRLLKQNTVPKPIFIPGFGTVSFCVKNEGF